MYSNSGYIATESGRLHYLKYGNGIKLLIAFHGYGESASLFSVFEQYVKQDYTLVSFNLPHHQESTWTDNAKFTITDLKCLIQNTIDAFGVDKASLIGYSMGGRVSLKAVEVVPNYISQVVLIASDGLVYNPFYCFVTRTYIGKRLFRSFLVNPKSYKWLIDIGKKNSLITESKYKFASMYTDNKADRDFLLKVWPAMSLLIPDYNVVNKIITEHNIVIDVFMGKHDTVIPLKNGVTFNKYIKSARLHVLEKGHRIFDNTSVPQIASVLL